MSTQFAQIDLTCAHAPDIAVTRTLDEDTLPLDRPLSVARGIANAALIAAPFWALFAFTIYLLL